MLPVHVSSNHMLGQICTSHLEFIQCKSYRIHITCQEKEEMVVSSQRDGMAAELETNVEDCLSSFVSPKVLNLTSGQFRAAFVVTEPDILS